MNENLREMVRSRRSEEITRQLEFLLRLSKNDRIDGLAFVAVTEGTVTQQVFCHGAISPFEILGSLEYLKTQVVDTIFEREEEYPDMTKVTQQ